jgi:hypothetical protein
MGRSLAAMHQLLKAANHETLRIMKRPLARRVGGLLAAAAAVLVAVACTQHIAGPPATTSAPPETVELQPGPHSAIADVDLPEGTVQCTTNFCVRDPHKEYWHYSAPYDDVVAFLRKRFATGRRYDTHGATWWNGLPPRATTKGTRARRGDTPLTVLPSGCGPMVPRCSLST